MDAFLLIPIVLPMFFGALLLFFSFREKNTAVFLYNKKHLDF